MGQPQEPDVVEKDSANTSDSETRHLDENKKAEILAQVQQAPEDNQPRGHAITALFRKRAGHNPDDVATQASVFDDPETAKYFQPHHKYENRHRFDPAERWTWREEKKLVSVIDWKVTAWACIAFFALDLPRSNMKQANTDDFLDDLGLDTNDYNLANTVETVTFLLAELPSQLISKKIGPDRWIPIQMVCWSIISLAQFWLNGRGSLIACRALIGLFQGGFIPDVILYLSYFFKGTELPLRLALFWMANRLTDVISPLMAYGLLRLRGVKGYEGWRWLFLIEGILTLLIGLWSWFMMTPSPTQTKAWYRPKGWFSEREEKILVNRILRDDPAKGDMHNRQAITPKMLWKSICDWHLWPIYALGLTFGIPAGPPGLYLTLSLRELGFDTFNSNLLSIPAQVGTTINMLILTWLSEVLNQRALLGLFTQFWFLPCVVSLAVLPADINRWAMYALITVLLSYPTPHPMHVGWTSRQSNAVRTRTVSAALYNMCVQLSSIASSNIYREDDRPEYRRGNRVLIGINVLNIALYVFVKIFYVTQNKRRDRIWNSMTLEEQAEYRETTQDEGSKRLDFRFAH